MRKKILSVISVLTCVVMLAGCGKKTLEKKVSSSELKQMNEQASAMIANNSEFKDCKIEINGNDLVYKYWFSFELSDAQVSALEKSAGSLESQAKTLKSQLEKNYNLSNITVSYIYYDVNDKEVFKAGV